MKIVNFDLSGKQIALTSVTVDLKDFPEIVALIRRKEREADDTTGDSADKN